MQSRTALAGLSLAALGAAFGASAAQAAAYIKFDGVPGEGKVEVSWKVEEAESAAPSPRAPTTRPGASDLAAPMPPPQTIALLLPAVQKAREAAAALPRGMECKVGEELANIIIRNEDTAQIVRVPVATITACSSEQISFNFEKVEWVNPHKMSGPKRLRYGPGGGGSLQ